MTLYKYTRADFALEILQSCKIRFTQLNALNDPFESFPPVTSLMNETIFAQLLENIIQNDDALRQVIDESIDSMYAKVPLNLRDQFTKEQLTVQLARDMATELGKRGKSFREFVRELGRAQQSEVIGQARMHLTNLVASEVAVLSLSSVSDNEVMWSHYADTHRGVVIGFDDKNPFFSGAFNVKYQTQRPVLDMTKRPTNLAEWKDAIQTICGVKNEAWSYEREFRLAYPIYQLILTSKTDSHGIPVYVAGFTPQAITTVILGSRIDAASRSAISQLLSAADFSHVSVFCELLDQQKYRVTIEDCGKPTNA